MKVRFESNLIKFLNILSKFLVKFFSILLNIEEYRTNYQIKKFFFSTDIDIEIFFSTDIGLSIDSGLHIKRIEPGSAAAKEETLSIGDKILFVRCFFCSFFQNEIVK